MRIFKFNHIFIYSTYNDAYKNPETYNLFVGSVEILSKTKMKRKISCKTIKVPALSENPINSGL